MTFRNRNRFYGVCKAQGRFDAFLSDIQCTCLSRSQKRHFEAERIGTILQQKLSIVRISHSPFSLLLLHTISLSSAQNRQSLSPSLSFSLTHVTQSLSLSLSLSLSPVPPPSELAVWHNYCPFFSSKPLRLFVRLPVRLTIVAECRKGLCYCHNLSNFRGSVLVGGREGRY